MTRRQEPEKILTIAKDMLAKLPAAHFAGRICVVDDTAAVEEAVARLRESDVIGFDTETRPSFKKGQNNTVALVQLSTRQVCYLFRINRIGLPKALADLLEDPAKTKVGLSIHDDFHNLSKIAPLRPEGFIELQNYVKDFGIVDNSLSKIHGILFGQRISKGQRLTNWEAETLTPPQQAYAALDAMACIRIYDRLSSGGFRKEDSPWLTDRPEPEPAKPIPSDQ